MAVDILSDLRFIKLAIELSKRGVGQTGSNPSVGCIITKNNKIVGRGITGSNGTPHAETVAITQAGKSCDGATMFVTLEPCSHYGRTPPCVNNIISSKISRVVCPLVDPDPRVSGTGFDKLTNANIELDFIPSARVAAEEITQGYFSRITKKKPYVSLKLGMSIDGKIASSDGQSKWITNSASRARAHLLRAQNDAILVGTNTLINDNPRLNLRGTLCNLIAPLRVFLDRELKVLPSDLILTNALKYSSIIVCGEEARAHNRKLWENAGVEVLQVALSKSKINLFNLLEILAARGINSLLVEGGGKLAKGFLVAGLIDKLIVHRSGVIIGSDGIPSFSKLEIISKEISACPKLALESVSWYGDNLETVWKPF